MFVFCTDSAPAQAKEDKISALSILSVDVQQEGLHWLVLAHLMLLFSTANHVSKRWTPETERPGAQPQKPEKRGCPGPSSSLACWAWPVFSISGALVMCQNYTRYLICNSSLASQHHMQTIPSISKRVVFVRGVLSSFPFDRPCYWGTRRWSKQNNKKKKKRPGIWNVMWKLPICKCWQLIQTF